MIRVSGRATTMAPRRQDTRLVRFLLHNALIGVAAGWTLLAVLLWTDAFALHTLVFGGEHALLALVMLGAGFAITFGSAAMGTAVFLLRPDDGDRED